MALIIDCDIDDGLLPDSAAIASAITDKTKAVSLVSPNNPAGSVYPPDLLLEIFKLCQSRGIWLILDETYRDFLPLDQNTPQLFAEDNWQGTLVQLYSFQNPIVCPATV